MFHKKKDIANYIKNNNYCPKTTLFKGIVEELNKVEVKYEGYDGLSEFMDYCVQVHKELLNQLHEGVL